MKNNLLRLIAVMLLLLSQPTFSQSIPSYVPQNGLVGWWPFNGNANDESGNGNNGTVNGATLTTDRFGNASKAYSFDGVNDIINIPSSNSLSNISLASVNFWIKSTTTTSGSLFKKGNSHSISSGEQISFQINFDQNQTGFTTKYNSNCVPGSGWLFNSISEPLNNGIWTMITGVITRDSTLLYVNSVLKKVLRTPNTLMDICNNGDINLGKNWDEDPDFYDGMLDDIGFWNRALSEQEIKNLYNGNICFQNVSVTDTLFINSTITSFNPITYENTIKIYPNPTQGQLTIDFGNINTLSGYQMKVINPLGQQIFQSNISQRISNITLSSFATKGVYFVQLIDNKGTITENRKIVIQ
jgi:hypothetical protein